MSAPQPAAVLVVAKAPVAGRVKTRLGRTIGMDEAAGLAAASLLDTLEACAAAYALDRCHLALEGDLAEAVRSDELVAASAGWTLYVQRGDGLAARLAAAHHDVAVATGGVPVVQVGMDTPQATPAQLRGAGDLLAGPRDAVLGLAEDGGWWLVGVGSVDLLTHLAEVPMSTDETGAETRRALERAGAEVHDCEVLRDVDEEHDARLVAETAPHGRFAAAWHALAARPATEVVG